MQLVKEERKLHERISELEKRIQEIPRPHKLESNDARDAQRNLSPSQSQMTTSSNPVTNVSGGVNASADQINVSGDIAGRDKILNIVINIYQSRDPKAASTMQKFSRQQVTTLLAILTQREHGYWWS